MEKIEITIVGAGVIGLAVAEALSEKNKDIFVIERNHSFGQETSSRNSEVIHAGIYYPKDSLKHKTCIEGRELLYAFCKQYNVACKKTGKLIVALDKNEIKDLEELFAHGLANGVSDLQLLTKADIKRLEPFVEAEAAIYSPSTGILDSHTFMKTLLGQFERCGGKVAYNTEVVNIEEEKNGFTVTVKEREGEFNFFSRVLINCAGLSSDAIARMAGLTEEEYALKYCKGDYFRVCANKAKCISRLVYPVPKGDRAGLGIHATLDLAGGLRLGPDDEYVERIDYTVDEIKKAAFFESTRHFLPFIQLEDISPDMAGIRPKLQGPGECVQDFVIKDEIGKGAKGFVNLIGIESPGLTSSLAIAGIVKEMVNAHLR